MASYLVTGTSRGVGLAVVAALAAKPAAEVSKILAAARSETEILRKIISASNSRVVFVPLEATSEESVKRAAERVSGVQGGHGIDVLINNAAVTDAPIDSVELLTNDELDRVFKINGGGVHSVTKGFLPELRKGGQKKIVNISSTLGSIGMTPSSVPVNVRSHEISKAALNMLTANYALHLENEGFTVVAVNPGWIRTDMGTSTAALSPEEGAKATLDVVFRVTPEETGKFLNIRVPGWENESGHKRYDGGCIPW